MAGWIKMPLGMEVGLGPGDFVFDANPASSPQKKGHNPYQRYFINYIITKTTKIAIS